MNEIPTDGPKSGKELTVEQSGAPGEAFTGRLESHSHAYLSSIRSLRKLKEGDFVIGVIVDKDEDEVYVDIGFESDGVLSAHEAFSGEVVLPADKQLPFERGLLHNHGLTQNQSFEIGNEIEVFILKLKDDESRLLLTRRPPTERAWEEVARKQKRREVVNGLVVGFNKSGLIVDIGLRGFVPKQFLELSEPDHLKEYVGKEIRTLIVELDRGRDHVVLSHRAYLQKTIATSRKGGSRTFRRGLKLVGMVSSIVKAGVIIDFGERQGIISATNLARWQLKRPHDQIEVGQEVIVEVRDVDDKSQLLTLSLKSIQSKEQLTETQLSTIKTLFQAPQISPSPKSTKSEWQDNLRFTTDSKYIQEILDRLSLSISNLAKGLDEPLEALLGDSTKLVNTILGSLPLPSPWAKFMGPVYSTSSLARLLKVSRQAVSERAAKGKLISLQTSDGHKVFPLFQFDKPPVLIPGISEVWAELKKAKADDWTRATWLLAPMVELANRSPISYLKSGGNVATVLTEVERAAFRWGS